MNCHTNTSISEFLAGISLLSIAIHAGIMYFMRPRIVSLRFDPMFNSSYVNKRSSSSPVINTDSDSENNQEDDTPESTEDNEKIGEDNGRGSGGFYSYFT